MSDARLLDTLMASEPGWMTIALFSQRDCAFCEEVREHYLKPMMATLPRRITIAELAPPIVGLSRDFFSAYLDQRIQIESKAVG